MNHLPHARDIIQQWSRTLGLDGLEWDDEGVIDLKIGEDLYLSVALDGVAETFTFCAQVLRDAAKLGPSLWRRLLITNTSLHEAGGPSFAIVAGHGALVLQQRILLTGLSYPEFERVWLTFVDYHEKAVAKLALLSSKDAGTAGESADEAELSRKDEGMMFFRI